MSYFVAARRTEWSADVAELKKQLIRLWPTIRISELGDDSHRSLDFEVQMPNSLVVGGVDRAGRCLIVEGELEDCVELALWFRRIVPAAHEVLLFDEGYSWSVPLRPATSKIEVIRAVNASFR